MNTKHYLAGIAMIALTFMACKKDSEEPEPSPGNDPAHVILDFRFMEGEEGWTLDSLLSDSAGHTLKVNTLKFYVSGIHAENDDEEVVGDWDGACLLVNAAADANNFVIGTMSPGHIHEFHFDLGLDSATNHADPTLAEAPLNDASMHWAWDPDEGYKFLLIEGQVDDDGDGVVDAGDPEFTYHCATDALLTEGHAHQHHTVGSGENYTAPFLVDMSQLFAGIDALDVPMVMGGGPTATRLMTNLSGAIDGEE